VFHNKVLSFGLETGIYICPDCGKLLEFEDEYRETLVCLNCGYEVDIDEYGYTEEELDSLYPREDELD